jgi:hypothetical protein
MMRTIKILLFALPLLAALQSSFAGSCIELKQTDAALILQRGDTPILTYHIKEVEPPEGVDKAYRRSGFIQPLHAPSGGVVTGIHPGDHYHHIGLWHAWVKTRYQGYDSGHEQKTGPDFWNLGGKTAFIRHSGILETRKSGFTVKQEHLAYLDGYGKKPTVILEETFSVDAQFKDGANIVDYDFTQTNVTKKALEFPAYRYGGGLAYRGPAFWNKENSDYLTSTGLDRTNSHATRAKWIAMYGPTEECGKNPATVSIFCHPSNFDSPQRLRTWDNGKMFFNYVPVQEKPWSRKPGKAETLRYRLVVSDGKPNKDIIEKQFQAYAKQ